MTGPDDLRARLARHSEDGLVAELASLRPRPGDTVGDATRMHCEPTDADPPPSR